MSAINLRMNKKTKTCMDMKFYKTKDTEKSKHAFFIYAKIGVGTRLGGRAEKLGLHEFEKIGATWSEPGMV